MAKNTNKRIPVKWIRDRAKSAYEKQDCCYICNSETDLELHHTHSITLLFENWVRSCGLTIETDDDILAHRDDFISEHHDHLYKHVFTLCNRHHVQLHSIYGKAPPLSTADRQSVWVNTQRTKHLNGDRAVLVGDLGSGFSDFY